MEVAGREKGRGFEYRVVYKARGAGLPARRVVLSGAGKEKLDVEIDGHFFECKYRSKGLSELYGWVKKARAQGGLGVIVGGEKRPPLVILWLDDFLEMMGKGEARK